MTNPARFAPFVLALVLLPATAHAQFKRSNPAVGETYKLEVSFGFWDPSPDITIASDQLALIGSKIDAVADLGFEQAKFREIRAVARLAKKHKVLFDYIPIKYDGDRVVSRTIVYNGVSYEIGAQVQSILEWKAYNFGYEYDFIYRDRGFLGVIGEVKYATVKAALATPTLDAPAYSASTEANAPLPAIGAIARGYVARNVSVTGQFTYFKLPESSTRTYYGRDLDYDIYGTVNFTDNFGVQGGYRALDVTYYSSGDSGNMDLKGWYLRGVVRF